MFKLVKIFLFLIIFFNFTQPVLAKDKIDIYFFYGDGCPHCAKEEEFLGKLEQEYSNINILRYEVWYNDENRDLLKETAKELKINVSGVPVTIVNGQAIVGFNSEETTGKKIKSLINKTASSNTPQTIKIPLLGEINIKNLSLPVLTIVIAALDGFNPCAMWVLLFLISLLLGMQNRRRMWILGSSFIIASGLVYFLFLTAWLNLFLFLGFIVWIRIIIGLVALASGGYNLRAYWKNPNAECKVTKGEKRKKIFEKLREVTQAKNFWLALAGIILLAFAVNLVELVCSAGLPAIYTQVLTLSNLASWQHYGYLLIYIIIFMLDDMLVFFIAMTTLRITGISTRYTRWSYLIGGILMVILGLLLIFKPGWLMFG